MSSINYVVSNASEIPTLSRNGYINLHNKVHPCRIILLHNYFNLISILIFYQPLLNTYLPLASIKDGFPEISKQE
jgi:hypothetical protein